jgi:small subunit ribosomal protein S21e
MITAKDHASVQINIGRVDENGHYTGDFDTVAFCGKLRYDGKSDNAMNEFALKKKIIKDIN